MALRLYAKPSGICLIVETLFPTGTWSALFTRSGTPKPVIDRIAAGVADYVKSPEAKAREAAGLMVFASSTPEEFQRKVDSEAKRYTEIAERLGWTPQ